jgi:L-lactate dehydrogenase complex protein LldF
MLGLEAAHPLPYASSLCGACEDACPVRIPIPDLLLEWRRRSVEAGLAPRAEAVALSAFAAAARRPRLFRAAERLLRVLPVLAAPSAWTSTREAPRPAPRTFRERWQAGDV